MKTWNLITIALTLGIYFLIPSCQCNRCHDGDLHMNGSRSWFPLKGQTQLSFIDNAGNPQVFKLKVIDTTVTALNDCGDPYKVDYITTALYLNPGKSDSIHFDLSSESWLCISAMTDTIPNIVMCGILGRPDGSEFEKRFSNFRIGTRNYQEVILLLHGGLWPDNIDSVFIANNVGFVGFRYKGNTYALQ